MPRPENPTQKVDIPVTATVALRERLRDAAKKSGMNVSPFCAAILADAVKRDVRVDPHDGVQDVQNQTLMGNLEELVTRIKTLDKQVGSMTTQLDSLEKENEELFAVLKLQAEANARTDDESK